MSKNYFKANSWLNIEPTRSQEARSIDLGQINKEISLNDHFIPGWKGESLPSKEGINLKNSINILYLDALKQFEKYTSIPRSLKKLIFEEFLHFAVSNNLNADGIDNYAHFWNHCQDSGSVHSESIQDFKEIYCFRLVTVYLYKIKFITNLTNHLGIQCASFQLLNPNSILAKIFRNGSSSELNCLSLKMNRYSWYRPSVEQKDTIDKLLNRLKDVSTTEMIKTCSFEDFVAGKNSDHHFLNPDYSHSLSHRSFGLFVNALMVYYPQWLKGKVRIRPNHSIGKMDVLNTKFVGDNLNSFSMSHWLAQENNVDQIWDEIICPDFVGDDFKNGLYVQICYELQFLNFLVQMAKHQKMDLIELICTTIRNKYSKQKSSASGQMNLLLGNDEVSSSELVYNRLVLNIVDIPKKNPHHFLVSQINQQLQSLDSNGIMLVFSNQKLFVPSQAERVENLLTSIKLDASFNFEDLKGKGEIPNYLYIFSKRKNKLFKNSLKSFENSAFSNIKESCLTFKISGELTLFKNYQNIVDELEKFFINKQPHTTPIFRSEIDKAISFEFHQDAIVNGKLLSSLNRDKSKVTHPSFFKGLTKSCSPLDNFFIIDQLDHNKRFDITNDLLGAHFTYKDKYPFVLVVDFSNQQRVSIEVVPSESYQATVEEYGTAYYQYFGIVPKIADFNINILREFFASEVGSQIIQLSLNGEISNLKSKLSSTLVPKFISLSNYPSESIQETLRFLNTQTSTLLDLHPDSIEREYHNIEQLIFSLSKKYPWYILGLKTNFKTNCFNAIDKAFGRDQSKYFNYNNPLILEKIGSLATRPLFDNRDVYLSFHIEHKDQIHLPLTRHEVIAGEEDTTLSLFSGDQKIATFHCESELCYFLDHILHGAHSIEISRILNSLQVPQHDDLKEVMDSYNQLKSVLNKTYQKTQDGIYNIFIQQISQSF